MNKKLKTYSDGSELTIAHVCAAVIGGFALMGVFYGTAAATGKVITWRENRRFKKNETDI